MIKENCIAIGIAVSIVAAMILYWNYCKTPDGRHKGAEISQSVCEATESKDDMPDISMSALNDAKYVTVEKIIRTTVVDQDGNSDTSYSSYVLSDISLVGNEDNTEDFTGCFIGDEYDDSKVKAVGFSDAFGFSYEGMTGKKLHDEVLRTQGFDGDVSEGSLDEEVLERTKEKTHVLADEFSITDQLLPDEFDGELLEKKVYCQMKEENEVLTPDYYTALVRYADGDKTVERSEYLQITVNDWEVE